MKGLLLSPVMFPQTIVSMTNEQVLPSIVMFVQTADCELVELGHTPQFDAMMLYSMSEQVSD